MVPLESEALLAVGPPGSLSPMAGACAISDCSNVFGVPDGSLSYRSSIHGSVRVVSGSRTRDTIVKNKIASKNPTQSQIKASIQVRPNLYLEPSQPWQLMTLIFDRPK